MQPRGYPYDPYGSMFETYESDVSDSEKESEDSETDDELYEEYVDDAYEFIRGVEQVNLEQFPQAIVQRVKNMKRKLNRQELINEMNLALNSMFDTRLTILQDFAADELRNRGIGPREIASVHRMVDEPDPSRMIAKLTEMERRLVSNNTLKNILEDNPKIAYRIVKRFSE